MKYVQHTFAIGDTIEGVIRLHNSHAMSARAAGVFMAFYNQQNGTTVPLLGQEVQIPVDVRIAKIEPG